jgi:hypothetical protein
MRRVYGGTAWVLNRYIGGLRFMGTAICEVKSGTRSQIPEERDKDGKGWEEATTKTIQSDVVKGTQVHEG